MSSVWSAVCLILGCGGLVTSFFVWRRKGVTRGLRAAAWSLIPLGAFLTGSATLLERISSAIARFAAHFAFSPETWIGVIFLGLAVVLFLTTGGLPVLRWDRRRRQRKSGQAGKAEAADGRSEAPAAAGAGQPRAVASPKKAAGGGDDFSEVEAILRRRGIK
jgi:hypothetical protein